MSSATTGGMLLSCGMEVKLHAVPAYETAHAYRPANGAAGAVRSVSWCKDGSWMSVVPFQGNVEIVHARDDLRLLQSVLGVAQPTAAAFQRTTKRHVAIGTAAGAVLVYDLRARDVRKTFCAGGAAGGGGDGGDGAVSLLDWSANDSHLAAAGAGGRASLYSNTTNQRTGVLTVPASRSVSALRFSPLQRLLLGLASDEGAVVVYDVGSGKARLSAQPHRAPVTDLAFSRHNKNLLATCALDRTCLFYDTNQAEPAVTLRVEQPLSALDLGDGGTLALGSTRGHVYIYDLRNYSAPLKTFRAHGTEVRRLLYQPRAPRGARPGEPLEVSELRAEPRPGGQEDAPAAQPASASASASADSFSQLVNSVSEFSPARASPSVAGAGAGGDSFLAQLELVAPEARHAGSFQDRPDASLRWTDASGAAAASALSAHLGSKLSVSTPRSNRLSFVQEQAMTPTDVSPITSAEQPGPGPGAAPPAAPSCRQPAPAADELLVAPSQLDIRRIVGDFNQMLTMNFLHLQMMICRLSLCQEEQNKKLDQMQEQISDIKRKMEYK